MAKFQTHKFEDKFLEIDQKPATALERNKICWGFFVESIRSKVNSL